MESLSSAGQWHDNCILCFEYLTTSLESVAAIQHAFAFCNVRLFSSDLQSALMSFVGLPIESTSKYDFSPILNLNLPAEFQSLASDIEAFCLLVETLNSVASFQCNLYEQHLNCLLTLADAIGNEDLADDIRSLFTYDQSETDPLKRLWSRTWFNIQHGDAVQHDPLHLSAIDKLKRWLCPTGDDFICHQQIFEIKDDGKHRIAVLLEESLETLDKSQEQEEEDMKRLLQWIWDGN